MRVSAISSTSLKILFACLNIIAGIACGLFVLEVTLHISPILLFSGILLSGPVAPALTLKSYDVRYADADTFFLDPGLIKPLSPDGDHLEAHINYQTDEFGFHNDPPLPATVDIAVVGRSYSLGAETSIAWPERFSTQTNLKVLNLAQIGSGNDIKLRFLQDYAFSRHPRWIIVEVLPRLDIVSYEHAKPVFLPQITEPIIHNTWFQLYPDTAVTIPTNENTIYPLSVQINAHTYAVTFSILDLTSLTISTSMLEQSKQWQLFRTDLSAIITDAHAHSSCVALLYAQSKAGAYLPLLQDSAGLTAARQALNVYSLNSAGFLEEGKPQAIDLQRLQTNVQDSRALIAGLAKDDKLLFIDPTDKMVASLQAGQDPFMAYDSHLSAAGHQLVADKVAEVLNPQVLNESKCN